MSEQDKLRFVAEKEAYVPSAGYGQDGKPVLVKGSRQSKTGKTKRAKKDKNLPKGALSSYIIFCTQMRSIIKTEEPEIANTDIMRQTGERWRQMTPQQKAPWEALSAQDKQRYEDEMAAYNESH